MFQHFEHSQNNILQAFQRAEPRSADHFGKFSEQPDEQRDKTIQEVQQQQSFCKPEPESAIDIDQSASYCPDNSSVDSNIIVRWPLPSGLEKEDVKGVDVQGNVYVAQPSGSHAASSTTAHTLTENIEKDGEKICADPPLDVALQEKIPHPEYDELDEQKKHSALVVKVHLLVLQQTVPRARP
ncbi:hypothetical protein quinque_007673 [Culex quinquefasciatus]